MATGTPPIPALDRKGLRGFGLMTGAIVALLFGLVFPWLLTTGMPRWPWIIGGALGLWALIAPASLRPVYHYWMRLALGLSRLTTPLILGVVFVFVILPVALVMKLVRRDPMARRFDETASSYRVPSRKAPPDHMEKPF